MNEATPMKIISVEVESFEKNACVFVSSIACSVFMWPELGMEPARVSSAVTIKDLRSNLHVRKIPQNSTVLSVEFMVNYSRS